MGETIPRGEPQNGVVEPETGRSGSNPALLLPLSVAQPKGLLFDENEARAKVVVPFPVADRGRFIDT